MHVENYKMINKNKLVKNVNDLEKSLFFRLSAMSYLNVTIIYTSNITINVKDSLQFLSSSQENLVQP